MTGYNSLTKGVGVFFLWCSRFGIRGDAADRSMTAMFVTAFLLGGMLFTTVNVFFFCTAGIGFLKWYAMSLPCATTHGLLCQHKWIIVSLFFIPGGIFANTVRRKYLALVGPRASGLEYLYSFIFYFAMCSVWIVSNSYIFALVSFAIYFMFFVFLIFKARVGVSSRNIWSRG